MQGLNLLPTLVLIAFKTCGSIKAYAATQLTNATAYIPAQCYTKTADPGGRVYNPCYVCHTRSVEPNYINDHQLQLVYSFPRQGRINPWSNLFADRKERIARQSDEQILRYIRQSTILARADRYFRLKGSKIYRAPGTLTITTSGTALPRTVSSTLTVRDLTDHPIQALAAGEPLPTIPSPRHTGQPMGQWTTL